MKRILVIAAHPDDETLGAGGTIRRLVNEGNQVSVFWLSNGLDSRGETTYSERFEFSKCKGRALATLGANMVVHGTLPDNQFDTVPLLEIAKRVEAMIEGYDTVFTHSIHDLNIDHRITVQAVLTATRPPSGVKEIYSFEIPSSTEWALGQFGSFTPNYFVDITDTLEAKMEAIKCYESEIRDYPHPRSLEGIKALTKVRGVQSGFMCAEGFELIRKLC